MWWIVTGIAVPVAYFVGWKRGDEISTWVHAKYLAWQAKRAMKP